jgi:glucose-6-phosphate 1-epimerase
MAGLAFLLVAAARTGTLRAMNAELRNHEIPGVATWRDEGLPVLDITAPSATARIYAHGAQLAHWQPAGAEPVIFMSAESAFEEGKAIRGGVPVCFPWFGPREGQAAHGFVRNRTWRVLEVREIDGAVRATFETASGEGTRAKWPHDFIARMSCTAGAVLAMEFEVTNTSREPFMFSEALHTYFAVGDAREVTVTGLEGAAYRDFPDRTKLTTQTGAIRFSEETDRVFVDTTGTCVIEDPVLGRRITVEKSGSLSTVVWNPWIAKAAALADFGDDEWMRMVCVETANAFENSVTLNAGATHRLTVRVSVAPMA